jgi:hypothetical protein
VTVKSKPAGVWINELLPVPSAVDWNSDGVVDASDEWIELYNAGGMSVDIGSWSLVGGLADTLIYTIPAGTVLEPGAFIVLYRAQTAIALETGRIRLVNSGGEVVDAVAFAGLGADASYSWDGVSAWRADWTPSPGAPNLAPALSVLPGHQKSTGRPRRTEPWVE